MSVKVYERILDLFEAEGINTLFGIPDPNFVHMFVTAEKRGWQVIAPITKRLPSRRARDFSQAASSSSVARCSTPPPPRA